MIVTVHEVEHQRVRVHGGDIFEVVWTLSDAIHRLIPEIHLDDGHCKRVGFFKWCTDFAHCLFDSLRWIKGWLTCCYFGWLFGLFDFSGGVFSVILALRLVSLCGRCWNWNEVGLLVQLAEHILLIYRVLDGLSAGKNGKIRSEICAGSKGNQKTSMSENFGFSSIFTYTSFLTSS